MAADTIDFNQTLVDEERTLLAGRYRVVRQLGQGGMGSVWLAEDTKLDGFKVAIKMLPSVLVNNKRAYQQVKAEALVSLKLSHPNIATVRAFEEESGSPFLVMDYIDGQTLDDYLAEKGKLTEEETVKLLKPVAAALDYAHTQGVVHRDVKPGNIMIRKDGTPFVLDFGIAREIQETMTRVTGKLSSGTLMYMSPEQLHGAAPKPAQDIYSFAAMAYECLKGEPPFSRGQIEYQIEHDTPAALDNEFSIAGGVMVGLAKQANVRPTTCVAVLAVGACVSRDRADAGVDASGTQMGSPGDSEYARIHEEIKRYEGILAQKEAERKAAEEARQRQLELQNAKERLEKLRRQVEKETSDFNAGDVQVIELPGGAKMEMVWCPPGSFLMGCPVSEGGHINDGIQHQVTLTHGFWIGRYEVTQRQWVSVMGKIREEKVFFGLIERNVDINRSRFAGADRPVENVSWDDCQRFIEKINATGDVTASLPTEAQWEYACRAGTPESSEDELGSKAWYEDNSCEATHSVGQKKPNAWGLYDMLGNVWEWCSDWYEDYPRGGVTDPTGPVSGSYRVCRGGGWSSFSRACHSSFRNWCWPGVRDSSRGFRIICFAGSRK